MQLRGDHIAYARKAGDGARQLALAHLRDVEVGRPDDGGSAVAVPSEAEPGGSGLAESGQALQGSFSAAAAVDLGCIEAKSCK